MKASRVNADLIGFSGGKLEGAERSQAEVGEEHFKSLAEQESLSLPGIFLDDQAKNTIENVRNILAHVRNKVDCPAKDVSLTLVSSDYHLDRLEIVDRRMPAQSLLKPVWEMVGDLNLLRAPYPYHKDCSSIQKWRGQLYRIADRLTAMRVNVEGVLEWRMDKMLPENVEDFRNNLLELSRALCKTYASEPEVQRVQIEIDRALTLLVPCYFQLAMMALDDTLSLQARHLLHLHYKVLDDGIDRINRATDPDEAL